MKIKVCGLTDKTDLEAIVRASPDYMGFIFYSKSKRFVENKEVAIINYPDIKKVGVFVNESIDQVFEIINECGLDTVQLHGDETPFYCDQLKVKGVEIIKAFAVDDLFDFATTYPFQQAVNYFLFDTKGEEYGGNGYSFNWSKLDEYKGDTFFLKWWHLF